MNKSKDQLYSQNEWNLFYEKIMSLVPLSDADFNKVAHLFTLHKVSKNTFFINDGEYAKRIAFVNKGVLRAFFQNEKGHEYNKTFFKQGSFMGAYSSLVSGQKNRINIQCLTDCELLIADYKQFVNLFDQSQKIERIARILAEQFFLRKEKREIELVTLEAQERYEIFKKEHPKLEQIIPQYYIASYLGITPTQLSRIRAKK